MTTKPGLAVYGALRAGFVSEKLQDEITAKVKGIHRVC
jgi:hypothetical protein